MEITGGQKKGAANYLMIIGMCVALLILFCGVGMASSLFGIVQRAEPALAQDGGSVKCSDWKDAPPGAQAILEAAASKFSIQPALLAAIFYQENGRSWRPKGWSGEESWPVSAGANAAGPFQFVPDTWQGEINNSTVKDKCGSLTTSDVNDPTKASCVAAHFIANKFINSGITNNTMTTAEQDIKDVAVAYTSSYSYFDNWRKSGRDPNALNPAYLQYHENVWTKFQQLYVGCTSVGGAISSNAIVAAAQTELSLWKSGQIKPTGDKNKYTNGKAQPWCADFVSWVYTKAGDNIPEDNRHYVPTMRTYFKSSHQLLIPGQNLTPDKVAVGDVISFNDAEHVGIISQAADKGGTTYMVIEGNTPNDTVSQRQISYGDIAWIGRW